MLLTKKSVFIRSELSVLIIASSLALFQAPAAHAAGSYFKIEAGTRAFKHDDVQATLGAVDTPAGEADGDINGHGIDVTLGGMPLQGVPVLTGSNPTLELQLHYASADDSRSQPASTGFIGFMPIDGNGISDAAAAATLDYETDFRQHGFDALVRSEVSKTATSKTSAIWGLTYSRFAQSHEFSGRDLMGATVTNAHLTDDVETDYFGLVLGLGTEQNLGSGWTLSASGRVDFLYADAELDADQTLTIFGRLSQSDDENKFAGRLQGKLGLAKDFGGVTVGANATVDYLSYAPSVVHPLYDLSPVPSHLEDQSLITYGLNLYLNVSF